MKKVIAQIAVLAAMASMFEQPRGFYIPPANIPGDLLPDGKPNRKRVKPNTFKKSKVKYNKTLYSKILNPSK